MPNRRLIILGARTQPIDADILIIAGQSNASGRGTNNQTYTGAHGKTAYNFTNAYALANLADPVDSAAGQVDTVSSDTSPAAAGSIWPLVATELIAATGRNVLFVPCAKGSTSITDWLPGANHQDRSTLYGSMIYRALQVQAQGDLRGVLWWQGETDAVAGMSQATYNGHLDTIANAVMADLGVPLMPCKLQNSSGAADADEAKINAAIAEAWGDNANVSTGPDLSDLASDDSFHLQTNAKLLTAAERWAQKILAAWLDLLPFSHNGTWALSGIDWTNTPTLGSDLISNGGFASDTVWTKGTGWTIGSGVATHAAGTAANITQNVLTAERWYREDWEITTYTAGNFAGAIGGNFGPNRAAGGTYVDTFKATSSQAGVRAADAAADGSVDNVVFRQLTLNTLMAVRQGTNVSCRPSVVTGTQSGFIVRLDSLTNPLYFIFGFINGANAQLWKCVNGVFTLAASGGVTPVAGAKLYPLNPSGNTWQLWYNGVQRGTDATISDVGSGIFAGGFSTHPSNVVSNLVVT